MASMASVIDGKVIAEGLRRRVQAAVERLKADHGFTPGLAVVLVGDNPASRVYVANKARQTGEIGMRSFEHRLPATAPEAGLLALVERLNADPAVDGILVQLPLPSQIGSDKVINAVNPDKDVDGFHVINAGRLATGQDALVPCTPLGCVILAKSVARQARRARGGGGRTLEHRRQAGGATAAPGECHGHHRPFANPRPWRGLPPRRPPDRGGRQAAPRQGQLAQAWRRR